MIPALSFQGLSVRFGGVRALDDICFDVLPRTIHAVIGPNGAGKTTFFNVISGLVTPSAGEVHLHGRRIDGHSAEKIAAARLARTFQNLAVFGDLTVRQNLLLGRHLQARAGWLACGLRLPRAVREDRAQNAYAERIAELTGVADLLEAPASAISYGDRKRVEIGRALCMEPSVLLLDEPVAGMNSTETQQMSTLIESICADFELTILLVEHDMGMVMSLADTVTVLDFGKLVTTGPPTEVQTDQRVIEAYLGTAGAKTFGGELRG